VTASGLLTASGLYVANEATLAAPASLYSTLSVSGRAVFGGNMTVSGMLTVSGITAGNSIFDLGAVTMNSTLSVSGNAVFGSSMAVSGAFTASGLYVRGPSTFQSALTVSGLLSASGIALVGPMTVSGQSAPDAIAGYNYALSAPGAGRPLAWQRPIIGETFVDSETANTHLGYLAGSTDTGANNTLIGYNAQPVMAAQSNQIVLGTSEDTIYVRGGLALTVSSFTNPSRFYTAGLYNFAQVGIYTSGGTPSILIPTVTNQPLNNSRSIVLRFVPAITGGSITAGATDNMVALNGVITTNSLPITTTTNVIELVSYVDSWYVVRQQ
jgi:hypothetical protein